MPEKSTRRLDISTVLADVLDGDLDDAAAYRRIYQAESERQSSATPPDQRNFRAGDDQCPVCSLSGVEFLPFGLADRKNARCPNCQSLERHRLLWLFLTNRVLKDRQVAHVLHTAPEPCLKEPMRQLWGERLVTLDLADPTCDISGDLCDLPISSHAFDLLLCSHVLEHIPDDRRAMAELARVTAPGGRAVIMVPLAPSKATEEDRSLTTPAERLERFGHPFHYRIYGGDIVEKLASHGLQATLLQTADIADHAAKKRYRLNNNHILDCRKIA